MRRDSQREPSGPRTEVDHGRGGTDPVRAEYLDVDLRSLVWGAALLVVVARHRLRIEVVIARMGELIEHPVASHAGTVGDAVAC